VRRAAGMGTLFILFLVILGLSLVGVAGGSTVANGMGLSRGTGAKRDPEPPRDEAIASLSCVLALPTQVSGTLSEPRLSPALQEALSDGEEITFLVLLTEQADLSHVAGLPTKEAKGRAVYDTLRAVAQRTQAPLRAELDALGVEYRPFYVVNMLAVRGDAALARALAWSPSGERLLFAQGFYEGESFARLDLKSTERGGAIVAYGPLDLPPLGGLLKLAWCDPSLAFYLLWDGSDGSQRLHAFDLNTGASAKISAGGRLEIVGCAP